MAPTTTAVAYESIEDTSIAGWPTKYEVAQRIGVSTKTVEKYVAEGKLVQKLQAQINRPARAVYDPASVERLIADRERMAQAQARPTHDMAELVGAIVEALAKHPMARTVPLYLTEQQAIQYTGLGRTALRNLAGRYAVGPRRAKLYRRSELMMI